MSLRPARAGPGIAALLAGALLPLAFAPLDWWPVAPLSVGALLWLLQGACPARAALGRGWLFGLGMFGSGASWVYVSIHDYGAAPLPLAAFLTLLFCAGLALFPAFCAWAWVRWLRGVRGGALFGFPALWVLVEWIRGWILTGFPWLYLGYSQVDGPLAGWAPVGGVFAVSLAVATGGAALAAAGRWAYTAGTARKASSHADPSARAAGSHGGASGELSSSSRARAVRAIGLALALWLAALPLARIEWTEARGAPRSVALVQGNIPQLLKWDPHHLENTLAIYAGLSQPLWGTDFVVWPESAVPTYLDLVTEFLSEQATQAAASGSALLLGIPTRDADADEQRGYRTYNSVVALGQDSGLYHKRRLVPFGEYVPLEGLLRGLIAFFDLPMSSFSRGPETQDLLRAHGIALGTFVCYEIAYPDLVRTALPEAGLLLTVSNDTWFGASMGPLQHLEIARMRALENGRDLVRGTNNGVSALVDARGRVTLRGGQFTRETLRGSVQPRSGLTPFARAGSWPVLLLCLVMVLVPVLAARRAEARPATRGR